jgi:hypothetical protein
MSTIAHLVALLIISAAGWCAGAGVAELILHLVQ